MKLKIVIIIIVPLLIFGTLYYFESVHTTTELTSYHEECISEGSCSSEELDELYDTYDEECLGEGCDTEELNEDAGGAKYIDDMLEKFLTTGWMVESSNFQSTQAPSSGWSWFYTGAKYSGHVTAINSDKSTMPNSFSNKTLAIQIGSGINYLGLYTESAYAGNSMQLPLSVSDLSTSYPTFAKTISSVKVNKP